MTAGSWTGSPPTSSRSKATRTSSSSRATTASTRTTRSVASARKARVRIACVSRRGSKPQAPASLAGVLHATPCHQRTTAEDGPMSFMQALRDRWAAADSLVCVGLDPEPAKFPARFAADPDAVFGFCRDIVDATAPYVCSFKPQIAHFAALGAEDALTRLIAHVHAQHPHIPVILDSKRGDIGSTAP